MSTKVKVKQAYQHATKGVIIVHWEADDGTRSNTNFPPSMFEGMTKEEIKEEIQRHIEDAYEQRKQAKDEAKSINVKNAIKEMLEGA